MERPEEVTRFLRCGGMNCDRLCEKGGKVEDCLTWRVHGYVEQLEAQNPKWISVEERLPEKCEYVLCIVRYGEDAWNYELGFMLNNAWVHPGRCEGVVTHWMPLPEPPKEN